MLNPKLIGGRFPQQEGEIAIPYEMLLYDDSTQEYNIGQTLSFAVERITPIIVIKVRILFCFKFFIVSFESIFIIFLSFRHVLFFRLQ